MKKILLIVLCGVLFVPLSAQDGGASNRPVKGNMQANLLLGKGMFYTSFESLFVPGTGAVIGGDITTALPAMLTLSDPNTNSLTNMIGVEFKYFIVDNISLSLSLAGSINTTPWSAAVDPLTAPLPVPGSPGSTFEQVILPGYVNIDAQMRSRVVANIGAQYYFPSFGNERVLPYAGIMASVQFANIQAESTYAGFDELQSGNGIRGIRTGRIIGWAPSITAGLEYLLLPYLTIGFEVRPVSMYYSGIQLFAAQGMAGLTGENTDWSFFSFPQFKIGFRF